MMRQIVPNIKEHEPQVSNLLKNMKPYEFCALGNLSLNLLNKNCHMNSQSCFKGFKGIFVVQKIHHVDRLDISLP
jgi:hypothetical protein